MQAHQYWRECKFCKQQIVWIKANGNYIPVNRESISAEDRRTLTLGGSISLDQAHVKHFDTCPERVMQSNE